MFVSQLFLQSEFTFISYLHKRIIFQYNQLFTDINEDEDEDEDEDDDDIRDDYNRDPYDRDSDEFEADRFERASDDFVLRHSSRIKKKYHKERSQSLQDLAVMKVRNHKRRSSGFAWERSGFRKNPFSYQSPQSKPYQGSGRYEHVESKVKRYIQDIKEQNKVSKYEEYMAGKNAGCVKPKGRRISILYIFLRLPNHFHIK